VAPLPWWIEVTSAPSGAEVGSAATSDGGSDTRSQPFSLALAACSLSACLVSAPRLGAVSQPASRPVPSSPALPASFLIDRDGYLAALALGPRAWDNRAAHALVEGLLAQ